MSNLVNQKLCDCLITKVLEMKAEERRPDWKNIQNWTKKTKVLQIGWQKDKDHSPLDERVSETIQMFHMLLG